MISQYLNVRPRLRSRPANWKSCGEENWSHLRSATKLPKVLSGSNPPCLVEPSGSEKKTNGMLGSAQSGPSIGDLDQEQHARCSGIQPRFTNGQPWRQKDSQPLDLDYSFTPVQQHHDRGVQCSQFNQIGTDRRGAPSHCRPLIPSALPTHGHLAGIPMSRKNKSERGKDAKKRKQRSRLTDVQKAEQSVKKQAQHEAQESRTPR